MLVSLCVILIGIKCAAFLSLSTTTMIQSCCLVVMDSLVMKSIVTTSHFHSGMGNGYSNPVGFLCLAFSVPLPFSHSMHLTIKLTTYFFIPSQNYWPLTTIIFLLYPRCPAYGTSCITFISQIPIIRNKKMVHVQEDSILFQPIIFKLLLYIILL
jgi:hypothetical protein